METSTRWGSIRLTHVLSLDIGGHLDEIAHAAEALGSYVDQLVEDRRAAPRDDIVSELVQAGSTATA